MLPAPIQGHTPARERVRVKPPRIDLLRNSRPPLFALPEEVIGEDESIEMALQRFLDACP